MKKYILLTASLIIIGTLIWIRLMWQSAFFMLFIALYIILKLKNFHIKKCNEINSIMSSKCLPDEYIKISVPIFKSKSALSSIRLGCYLSYIAALWKLGEYNKCIEELKNINYEQVKTRVPLYLLLYYSLNRKIEMKDNNIDKANYYQNMLLQSADLLQHKKKYAQIAARRKNWEINSFDFEKGNYDQCFDYYFSIFTNHNFTREETVIASYKLAIIESLRGNIDKAKEYFSFIAHYGGTLFIAKEAQKVISHTPI